MEEQQKLDNEEQPKTEVHDEIQLQTTKTQSGLENHSCGSMIVLD